VFLERLELVDIRSYHQALLELRPGTNVLVGGNAQGKTNLVEAIHYLGIGGTHRTSSEAALVRAGRESGVIRAGVRLDTGRALAVEVELRPGGRNRARVNGQSQPRYRQAIGLVRSVLFAPEDLQLIRGDPTERRRFLDDLLAQRRPAYLAARQEYERVLRQRNALLRGLRGAQARSRDGGGHDASDATLTTWNDALVRAGAVILAARIAVVHALAGPTAAAYADLAGAEGQPSVELTYELSTGRRIQAQPGTGIPHPATLADELRAGLAELAPAERERGVTLAGPHRDDLDLRIGTLPAKGFASHGEQWSLALALRLASHAVLHEVGEEPIVLLDDVFAELDVHRRQRLAARCTRFQQAVVTAAVEADVPLKGPRYWVGEGAIRPVTGAGAERPPDTREEGSLGGDRDG
jgi:DNA replication and repair protein RecF